MKREANTTQRGEREPRCGIEPAYPTCPQDTSGAVQGDTPLEPPPPMPAAGRRSGVAAQVNLAHSETRGRVVKVRVTEPELADFRARAAEADMTVSDLVRFRLCNFRLRQTAADHERVRQLARIGSNLNQLARWANTHKSAAHTVKVVLWLNRLLLVARKNSEGSDVY